MVPQCCNPATGEQGQSGYTWFTGHIGKLPPLSCELGQTIPTSNDCAVCSSARTCKGKLKEAVSQDFLAFFLINPTHLGPDKQSKMVLLKNLFS